MPPHVQSRISAIIERAMGKIDPELKEIAELMKANGINGTIQFGMAPLMYPEGVPHGSIPSPLAALGIVPDGYMAPVAPPMGAVPLRRPQPKPQPEVAADPDVVKSIKLILDHEYGEDVHELVGMIYDRNLNTAVTIGAILEAARKRDRESLARELEALVRRIVK